MLKFLLYISVVAVLAFTGACTSAKIAIYNYSNIDDYKIFASRQIKNQGPAFRFTQNSSKINLSQLHIILANNKKVRLDKFLSDRSTKSMIIIKDDMILYEKYFNGYSRNSTVTSFSAAKSFVSALVGIAIQEGHIKSIDQPVTHFIPELAEQQDFEKITLKHLLQMTSGIRFDERYRNPLSDAARIYYDSDLTKQIQKFSIEYPPGLINSYKSIDTQLLGIALRRATGKSLSNYLQEKIWKLVGMESHATWSIDSDENGVEKAFCCLNALPVDFAKFGRLYLNKGNWNGEQIVPKEWVSESTKISDEDGSAWWYQYQWWIDSPVAGDFSARGLLGQYIYVNPRHNIIIVRFGDGVEQEYWPSFFRKISAHIIKLKHNPDLPLPFKNIPFHDFF